MDFVKIDYTARLKGGRVFDTTSREEAENEGVLDENRVYRPLNVVVGEGQVIKGLDEELGEMKVGDEKEIEIPPEKAYGQRDTSRIRLVPRRVFKNQGVNPIPGMPVEIDGMAGRVQTVSGGRIRVDFNHELAGKDLVFDVKVVDKAKNNKEKAEALVEKSFNDTKDFKIDYKNKKLSIQLPQAAYRDKNLLARKASLAAEAYRYLKADEVVYTEVWPNPEKGKSRGEKAKKAEDKQSKSSKGGEKKKKNKSKKKEGK